MVREIDAVDGVSGASSLPLKHEFPTVAALEKLTLEMLDQGVTATAEMRARMAQRHGIERTDERWPAFVNNHAWALVRLERRYAIRKVERGVYRRNLEPRPLDGDVTPPIPDRGPLPTWADQLRQRGNRRNRAMGFDDILEPEDFRKLWKRCQSRCALTGLQFLETQIGTGRAKRALAPSLDRIDPEGPYSLENCRLVLAAVNFALNRFGVELFDRMVVGRARTRPWLKREIAAKDREHACLTSPAPTPS